MEDSEATKDIYETSNYEDWNVLSMERRAALGIRTEPRIQSQLEWMLEEVDESEYLIEP